jgi:5,10-methylenetetrahydrofolate reductase
VIASRCKEIDRDPATLRVSVNIGRPHSEPEGQERVDLLRAYADAGVDRVMTLVRASAGDDGALERFAEDCVKAGAELDIE